MSWTMIVDTTKRQFISDFTSDRHPPKKVGGSEIHQIVRVKPVTDSQITETPFDHLISLSFKSSSLPLYAYTQNVRGISCLQPRLRYTHLSLWNWCSYLLIRTILLKYFGDLFILQNYILLFINLLSTYRTTITRMKDMRSFEAEIRSCVHSKYAHRQIILSVPYICLMSTKLITKHFLYELVTKSTKSSI